jgi:hypothetical protein
MVSRIFQVQPWDHDSDQYGSGLKHAETTQWQDERHVYFQGPEICTHCERLMNLGNFVVYE